MLLHRTICLALSRAALYIFAILVLWVSQIHAALILDFRADDPNIQLVSGNRVSVWPDQAQGLNAVQHSNPVFTKPTLQTLTVNGQNKPAVVFAGDSGATGDKNQALQGGTISVPSIGSMFAVFNYTGASNAGFTKRLVGWENAGSGANGFAIAPVASGGLYAVARNGGLTGDVGPGAAMGSDFEIVSVTWGPLGVNMDRTGYSGTTTHVGTNTTITSIGDAGITKLEIGMDGSSLGFNFQGAILELSVYNTQLSGSALTDATTQLYNRWFNTVQAPEPSSIGLLGISMIGLPFLSRRRRS